MRLPLKGWIALMAICLLTIASGCRSEAPLSTDEPPDDAIPFHLISREDLPDALDTRIGQASGEPHRGHSYLLEEAVYLYLGASTFQEIRHVQMDNGSKAIVAVVTESSEPYVAKVELPEEDRWWPVLFRDVEGNDLAAARIHEIAHPHIRAGETVYVHFYVPDLEAGCLGPQQRRVHTRPAPNIVKSILDDNVESGLLKERPEISSVSVGSEMIEVDFRSVPQMIGPTPLKERLLFCSLSNTLLEYYDNAQVRFTLNGGEMESPTRSLDLNVPFRFDDTFVRYKGVVGARLLEDPGEFKALFDELRLKQPDGAYAEDYAARLGDAFREDPLLFIKALSMRQEEEMTEIGFLLAYNCSYFDLSEYHEGLKKQVTTSELGKRELLARNTVLAALEDSRLGFRR